VFQAIAPYLDDLLFIVPGIFAIFVPERYVKKEGAGKERQKKIDGLQTCGAIFVLIGVVRMGMTFFSHE
jgi:hypothetical protein